MPGIDQKRKGTVEIGIGKDNLRRFSAQFQRHRDDILRGGLLHLAAGFERSGEGEMIDIVMGSRARHRLPRRGRAPH
jgi:hypothetical protein